MNSHELRSSGQPFLFFPLPLCCLICLLFTFFHLLHILRTTQYLGNSMLLLCLYYLASRSAFLLPPIPSGQYYYPVFRPQVTSLLHSFLARRIKQYLLTDIGIYSVALPNNISTSNCTYAIRYPIYNLAVRLRSSVFKILPVEVFCECVK